VTAARARWGFGIVQAQELQEVGKSAFDELCARASEAAGVALRPVIASSYRELARGIAGGELALAWLPPLPSIEVESQGVGTVLAIPARNGLTTYHSALVVRRGGPRTLADLKGRRAVWVQRDSASGYIIPRMHLASKGIDVLRYFSREMFVHSHVEVIETLVGGDADVGATYCHVGASGKVVRGAWLDDDARSVRPIEAVALFGPVPNDAIVASNELSASVRSALTRWLLAPPPEARGALASILGSAEFRVPSLDHYSALKHMVRAARARMA
jgi:ABC-type phosphate/phosphonate transport system substrate-binding protein